MASVRRQTGKQVAEGPKLRPEAVHVWNSFAELHHCRGSTGFGPGPITYSEIEAYSRVTRSNLSAWEVAAIRALDNVYFEVTSQHAASVSGGQSGAING